MAGELLDFTISSVVHFADSVSDAKKALLTESLQTIREQGHVVVRDFCVLGQRLKELRDGGLWRNVLDANGQRYDSDSFYAFCEDVLGFSKTKTQNMISLSAFVRYKDGDKREVEFIDPEFSKYNTSQLIELSSVPSWERKYYAPSFSVKDMRLVKAYTKYHGGSYTPEEMLERARTDAAKKDALKNRIEEESKKPEPTEPIEQSGPSLKDQIVRTAILDYLRMWPFDSSTRKEIISAFRENRLTQTFAYALRKIVTNGNRFQESYPCGSVQASWWCTTKDSPDCNYIRFVVLSPANDEFKEVFILEFARYIANLIIERKYGLPDEYPDAQVQETPAETPVLDETYEVPEGEELTEETASEDVSEEAPASEEKLQPFYKNWDFATRDGRRKFLADYQTWTRNPNPTEFSFFAKDVYSVYIEPIGTTIYAVETRRLVEVTGCCADVVVLYYLIGKDFSKITMVAKEHLNEYLSRRTYKL